MGKMIWFVYDHSTLLTRLRMFPRTDLWSRYDMTMHLVSVPCQLPRPWTCHVLRLDNLFHSYFNWQPQHHRPRQYLILWYFAHYTPIYSAFRKQVRPVGGWMDEGGAKGLYAYAAFMDHSMQWFHASRTRLREIHTYARHLWSIWSGLAAALISVPISFSKSSSVIIETSSRVCRSVVLSSSKSAVYDLLQRILHFGGGW